MLDHYYGLLYSKIKNGKGYLWYFDGYFFKTRAKASDFVEYRWIFGQPHAEDIVKHPRGVDLSKFKLISATDGTWEQL